MSDPFPPEWPKLAVAKIAHHAAFRAWRHTPTGTVLVQLWIAGEREIAEHAACGYWRYELRKAGRRLVIADNEWDELAAHDIKARAGRAIEGMLKDLRE